MKMKKYKNILCVSRASFCFKLICAFVAVMFLIPSITAQSKPDQKKSEIVITGSVLDAHTRQPVKAAQISIPTEGKIATTDDKGEFCN